MKAKGLNNWNIVRIVETGIIGIVRNDCLPANMKRHVCVQLQDKTAVVISGNSEVELYKDFPEIVYDALANINAAEQGLHLTGGSLSPSKPLSPPKPDTGIEYLSHQPTSK